MKGGNKFYSDLAITLCLQLRQIFKFGLRQTQGLVNSLFALMKIDMLAPDYTTLSRRMSSLKIKLPSFNQDKNTILMIDSSGLEMYEGGEWAARKRGYCRYKMWRKLHIVIDGETQIIQECALTPNSVDDAEMTKCLLKNVKDTSKRLMADAGYDKYKVYDFLDTKGIKPVIKTRRNAIISKKDTPAHKARNKTVQSLKDEVEKEKWKQETGYSRRALVETAFYRYKRTFGERLLARKLKNQKIETQLNCLILNKMLSLKQLHSKTIM